MGIFDRHVDPDTYPAHYEACCRRLTEIAEKGGKYAYLFRTLDTYPFTVQKDLIFIDQQGNVKNWMETDEFRQCADFFHKLYQGGYVPEDVLSAGWSSWNTMLTGDFIWVDQCQLWDTEQVWKERIPGVQLDTIYLNQKAPPFRSSSFRNDTAVSATSEHPEAAVKFMDWMYSSQENYDLMVYGVEGLACTPRTIPPLSSTPTG